MSPAAAELASACSAPGPLGVVEWVEAGGGMLVEAGAVVEGAAVWPELPQPVAATASVSRAEIRANRDITVSVQTTA